MVATRKALAALCAGMLVACERAADTITGPDVSADLIPTISTEFLPGIPVLDPFASPDDAGVIESARGGGHFHIVADLRTFAFTAQTRPDGTRGQYQFNNRQGEIKEHGVVTCLEVHGNEAWIGGIATHTNAPEGLTQRVWKVVDNGEGSNDPPDQMSTTLTINAQTCHTAPLLNFPVTNIEYGNIQVRDAP